MRNYVKITIIVQFIGCKIIQTNKIWKLLNTFGIGTDRYQPKKMLHYSKS